MDAKVKIGCLRNAEHVRTPFYLGGGGVPRWTETYETTRMVLALPEEGTEDSTMECPVCAKSLTLRRTSPTRVYGLFQLALVAVATICFAMATATYFVPFKIPIDSIRGVAIGFAVGGVIGFVAAWFSHLVPANYLHADLVKIRDDEARFHDRAPWYSGRRGHTILEVHVSEPVPTLSA